MSNLHIFTYNNHQITFDFGAKQKMVNATEMAKPFKGKLPADFLRLKQTKAFIEELKSQYGNSHIGKIVKV
ncbi:MAG: KilA-N domain-containing protein, partial [Chitinophagales bacterium]